MQFYLFLLFLVGHMVSCAHSNEIDAFGIQKEHIAFVPARIAVIPCQLWPAGAPYRTQPTTNFDQTAIDEGCKSIDAFVLEGFKGQPYMRGISPKVVHKLLGRNNQSKLLSELPKLWHQDEDACSNCRNAVSYYKKSIATRGAWQQWLTSFSAAVYSSDAILAPFLLYGQKGRINDRGLMVAYKKVGLALLLIDTNNGRLIWAGGRDVQSNNRRLETDAQVETLTTPNWKQVSSRLLISDVWIDFPGRQNY